VCIGVDAVWNTRAIHIAQQSSLLFPGCVVKAALGLHPSEISYEHYTDKDMIDRAIVILEQMIIANKDYVVAVGECGMDAHYENFQQHKALQVYLFEQQCMLARRHALPIVIHSRDAFDETITILEHYTDLKIYMHCRSYSPEQLTTMITLFPQFWV
jgi:TatD DNase family protein